MAFSSRKILLNEGENLIELNKIFAYISLYTCMDLLTNLTMLENNSTITLKLSNKQTGLLLLFGPLDDVPRVRWRERRKKAKSERRINS